MSNNQSEGEDILRRLFAPKPISVKETLEELFNNRINTLNITKTKALDIMGMTVRTLDGILTGQQKMLDYTNLIRLANFIGIELETVATLYLQKIKEVHVSSNDVSLNSEVVEFINEKFNLAELKKVGLIKSLSDYDEITESICNYFGLSSIFDYREPILNVAFSSGKRAKRNCSIKNWVYLAEQTCIELRNPNKFDREELINYFPDIRWRTMDVDKGLINVIKHLYQLGITVVYIPSFPTSHIKGATFSINDKPCIALTDYVGFYPTLWFTLIHELYHVLFDWEEIQLTDYHITLDFQDNNLDNQSQNEIEADNFAREYLFSKKKTAEIKNFINNPEVVKNYTIKNNVDPSFAYVFYAFDAPKTDRYAWGRARKRNPNFDNLKRNLENHFKKPVNYNEHIKSLRSKIYN